MIVDQNDGDPDRIGSSVQLSTETVRELIRANRLLNSLLREKLERRTGKPVSTGTIQALGDCGT